MKKLFTVLLSLAFLASMTLASAQTQVDTKGKKGGKEKIETAGKKTEKKSEKVMPPEKSQKGGKKGSEKVNAPAKNK